MKLAADVRRPEARLPVLQRELGEHVASGLEGAAHVRDPAARVGDVLHRVARGEHVDALAAQRLGAEESWDEPSPDRPAAPPLDGVEPSRKPKSRLAVRNVLPFLFTQILAPEYRT